MVKQRQLELLTPPPPIMSHMHVRMHHFLRTGTGKTLLAKAAATETGATFIELKISDVVRGEIGESEKVRSSPLLPGGCGGRS